MEKREIKAALEAIGLEKKELLAFQVHNFNAESHLRAWIDGVYAANRRDNTVSWAVSDALLAFNRSEELISKLLSAFDEPTSGCEHGG